MGLGGDAGGVAAQEGPEHLRVLAIGHGSQIEQHGEGDLRARALAFAGMMQHLGLGRIAAMDVPDGIAEAPLPVLPSIARQELQIFVHGARNDVKMQALGLARLLEHEERQALGAGVGEPFLDGEAIALGLGDLLALLVQKQLVVEAFWRDAINGAHDVAGELDGVDEVLARHLVIHMKRIPAHGPIGLPLQLAMAAGDGRHELFVGLGVAPCDRARLGVHGLQRHLHDHAGHGMDRQEGRIGGGALGAQRGQHDRLQILEPRQHMQQRGVEAAGLVILRRGGEFVIEAEAVEEGPQHRVVVVGEALELAEGIGDLGERLAQMRDQQLLVGDIVGDLAQSVHIVREGEQARGDAALRQDLECMAHHGGAGHLAEGADMGQARGAIARLEEHFRLAGFFDAGDEFARLLEGPGGRGQRSVVKRKKPGGRRGGVSHFRSLWRRAAGRERPLGTAAP